MNGFVGRCRLRCSDPKKKKRGCADPGFKAHRLKGLFDLYSLAPAGEYDLTAGQVEQNAHNHEWD